MRESMITAADRRALSKRTAYGMVREAYLKIIFSLVYSYIYGRSPIEYSVQNIHEQPRVSNGQAFNERTDCSSIF